MCNTYLVFLDFRAVACPHHYILNETSTHKYISFNLKLQCKLTMKGQERLNQSIGQFKVTTIHDVPFYMHLTSAYGMDRPCISELSFASVSKRVQVQNISQENEFDLHLDELVSKTHFHIKGLFAPGLVLKQR